jgi:hypothetical protein
MGLKFEIPFFIVFLSINKKQTLKNMKQSRNKWAIIALFFVSSFPLSAQNLWLPMPKEWVAKVMQLLILSKKMPVQNNATTACIGFSNEITITIAPCADVLNKTELVIAKPVQ